MEATYLYYDKEWEEWQVLYIDHEGKIDDEKTYHTDDYHDAVATQKLIKEGFENNKT